MRVDQRTLSSRVGVLWCVMALGACVLVVGCRSPNDARHRPLAQAPSELAPDRLSMFPGPLEDTDHDGWPDAVRTTLYLFSIPYSQPYTPPGSLLFRLTDMEGREFTRWPISKEDVLRTAQDINGLRGFRIRLRLPQPPGGVRFPRQSILAGTFTPFPGGEPVTSSVVLSYLGN
ncbi:MAG: hypothetical protein H6811_00230 [Phycisphaeraceae bacterium]|nr:hypothetical protein [Phycisphaeraceae bacterium]